MECKLTAEDRIILERILTRHIDQMRETLHSMAVGPVRRGILENITRLEGVRERLGVTVET